MIILNDNDHFKWYSVVSWAAGRYDNESILESFSKPQNVFRLKLHIKLADD